MGYVDESTVLDFYLSQMKQDKVKFLQGREDFKHLFQEILLTSRIPQPCMTG